MAQIVEKQALKTDEEKVFSNFPPIPANEVPLLLIYDANTELHEANIKGIIVDFLIRQKARSIQSYIYSSIHFRLKTEQLLKSDILKKLNIEFAEYIDQYETKYKGKVFWIFQCLEQYINKKDMGYLIGMLGRGNKTLNDNMHKQAPELLKG